MLSGTRLRKKVLPLAQKLSAAGDPTRLAILYFLAHEPMEVSSLVAGFRISPSLVSHHLRILLRTGWVTKTKYGKLVTYYLNPNTLDVLQKELRSLADR